MTHHPEDLPSDDSPADSDAPPGTEEPDPAEVTSDEDDEVVRDASQRPGHDPYRRDTLDERLSEEEPDRAMRFEEPEIGGLQAPESGDDDIGVLRGEPDRGGPADQGGDSAEESAIHSIPDDRR